MRRRHKLPSDEELSFQRYQFGHLDALYPWWQMVRNEDTDELEAQRLDNRHDYPLRRSHQGVDAYE